ncbi:MAG TPA: hypothetical protein VMX17_13340 [Candidatus Glassbacteria bacterium]|nr:hypothetical protein [Candidatus Glassbacteria bacterium]
MGFAKILNHPDRDQIISRLTSGDSSREVSSWLKEKYPKDKNRQVSYNTLNEFRKTNLNIDGAVLNDIKTMMTASNEDEAKEKLNKLTIKNKTYQEKIAEVVDIEIDWRLKLIQLMNVVENRFAQLYDKSQNNPDSFKADYVMINWMNTILEIVEKIRKVEGAPDQIIQHNVTIQKVEEHTALIQEAIRRTFAEVDLETSLLLMEKFSDNLETLHNDRENLGNETVYNQIDDAIDRFPKLAEFTEEPNKKNDK